MAFRYTSAGGDECVANSVDELEAALRAGEIDKTTPILDDTVGARLQAGALIMMKRREMPKSVPAVPPRASPPAPKPQPMYGAAQSDAESDPKRVRRQRFAATAVGTIALVVASDKGDVSPYAVGQFTTWTLVGLLVVVTLWGLIFGRKTDAQKIRQAWAGAVAFTLAWIGIAVMAVSFRAADAVTAKAIADEARKRADEFQETLAKQKVRSDAAAEAMSSPGYSPPSTVPAGAAPTGGSLGDVKGGSGSMTQRTAPVIAAAQAAGRKEVEEYNAYLESLNLATVLAPQTLTSAAGRKRNAETVARFIAAFDAHHQRALALVKKNRQNLDAAMDGHPGKTEFMAGLDKSMANSVADLEEMREIQHGVADKMLAINDFIGSRAGTISLQDGQLMFQTNADLATFQKLAKDIAVLGDREEKLQNKQITRMRNAADKIENLQK